MAEHRAGCWTISAGSVTAPAASRPGTSISKRCVDGPCGSAGLRQPSTDKDKVTSSSCCPAKNCHVWVSGSGVGAAWLTGSSGRVESEFHQHSLGMNYDLLFISFFSATSALLARIFDTTEELSDLCTNLSIERQLFPF